MAVRELCPPLVFLLALLALLALPFALRPKAPPAAPATAADRLVVISAHNKGIRDEYTRAFRDWYRRKHGRDVEIDFRSPGGTSDIVRYITDRFEAEFRRYYEEHPGFGPWSAAAAAAFADPRGGRTAEEKRARKRFLASDVGIGIDLFAGGGTFDQARMAERGYAVDGGLQKLHPDYFRPEIIPPRFGGDRLYDPAGRYYGVVLSTFGILYNIDRIRELGMAPPTRWRDLADPRYFNTVAAADPTKSGSANKCFEILIQQCMAEQGDPGRGWREGINLIKRIFANARNISDAAGKVARDVASGEAAVGMAIDTYGISEQLWSKKCFGGSPRCIYVTPKGGTAVSADPVQLLRGAPHPEVAREFIGFLLSREGQLLHAFRPGVPGGPEKNALNRPPIRRDLYTPELRKNFFAPDYSPYESGADFVYRPEWTGRYYTLLRILLRAVALDPHAELQRAWRAIIAAGGPRKVPRAAACFDALPFEYSGAAAAAERLKVTPERSAAEVGAVLREWSDAARQNYREAAKLAREGK